MAGSSVKGLKKVSLTQQIIIALVAGLLVGILVGPAIAPIKLIGDIWMRLIMMSVAVLLLIAGATSVGRIRVDQLGKIGLKVIAYFVIWTVVAVVFGVAVALIMQPGSGMPDMELSTTIAPPPLTNAEIVLDFFPKNIVASLAAGNNLQVVVFALFLGVALSAHVAKTKNETMLEFLETFRDLLLQIVGYVIKLAPIGVFSLIAWVGGTMGLQVVLPLLRYLLAVFIATFLYMLFLIAYTSIKVKVSIGSLVKKLLPMSMIAAGTTSSAIAFPQQLKDTEEQLGVSRRINHLVNPLGLVLMSAGQAIFVALAAIMLMQFFNQDMSIGRILQVVVVGTLACMGTLTVPGGALVIFAGMMVPLGLPIEGLALIAGVDWFRGMITTAPQVAGDALIAMIIAKEEGEFNRDIYDGKIAFDPEIHVEQPTATEAVPAS